MVGVGTNNSTTTEIYDPATGLDLYRLLEHMPGSRIRLPFCPAARSWWPGALMFLKRTAPSFTTRSRDSGAIPARSTLTRYSHTATLLLNGRVLAAGGINGSPLILNSAELYDTGLGFAAAWRPVVSSFPAVLKAGSPVNLSGSGFRGISEASGGATNDSPTDYPLVQLRRLDNEMAFWLPPDPAHPFSATAFTPVPSRETARGVLPGDGVRQRHSQHLGHYRSPNPRQYHRGPQSVPA